jgi:nucleotide-binding universal stress UspA family protein
MYRSIVVGTDGSETATIAVEHAAQLARTLGATLHVVGAYHDPAYASATASACTLGGHAVDFADWSEEAYQQLKNNIGGICRRVGGAGLKVVSWVERGEPSDILMAVASEVKAELIVVGDRGLKGVRRLFGSVPGAVARKAPVAVLVVHTDNR